MMGIEPIGSLCAGGPANLIIFDARTINELVCRPQADRVVVNAGCPVTDALPAYADLDVS
jgi:cytosine deaminase